MRNHRKVTLNDISCVILCKICIRHMQRIKKRQECQAGEPTMRTALLRAHCYFTMSLSIFCTPTLSKPSAVCGVRYLPLPVTWYAPSL